MQNPSFKDLLLINNVYAFQKVMTIYTGLTGLSDCKKVFQTIIGLYHQYQKLQFLETNQKKLFVKVKNNSTFLKFKNELKKVLTEGNFDSCTKLERQFLKT